MDPELLQLLLSQMGGGMPMLQGAGAYQDGSPKANSISTQSSQGNVLQDWLQIMMDPALAAVGGANGIPGGLDYMQYLDDSEGEQAPQILTPTWDNYKAASDPLSQQIAAMVEDPTMTRAQINEVIRSAGLSPELATDYVADVDAMLGERTKAAQAQADFASKPRKLSPVEQMYRDAGLPSPLEEYTADNVAGNDLSGAEGELDKLRQKLAAEIGRTKRNGDIANTAAQIRPGGRGPADPAPAGGSDYDAQAPITQAWWNAQKGANTAMDGLGAVYGAAEGAFNAPVDALAGLFRKPSQPEAALPVVNDGSSFLGRPNPNVGGRVPAQRGRTSQTDQRQLQEQLTRRTAQLENTDAAGRRQRASNMREAGRTPSSDAIASRQMMMRAFGLA